MEHEKLLILGRLRAEQRFAWFLLNLSERFAQLHKSPSVFYLSMPRRDIANYLGMITETLSHLIKSYKMEGIIHIKNRWVEILDFARLKRHLDSQALPLTDSAAASRLASIAAHHRKHAMHDNYHNDFTPPCAFRTHFVLLSARGYRGLFVSAQAPSMIHRKQAST